MNLLCCASVCRSMSVGGITFPLEQQSKDPQSVVYTGQYDTEGVAHTKSGERQPVQINIQVWIYCTQGRKLTSLWRQSLERPTFKNHFQARKCLGSEESLFGYLSGWCKRQTADNSWWRPCLLILGACKIKRADFLFLFFNTVLLSGYFQLGLDVYSIWLLL